MPEHSSKSTSAKPRAAAVDLTAKQVGFINRQITATCTLLAAADLLQSLKSEWDANAYATGANPPENNISDATVAIAAPHMDAVMLNQLIAAVVTIGGTVASNRGYLEDARP
jgi:hypothetical protein